MTHPTLEDVAKKLVKDSRKASLTLRVLGGLQPFVQAMSSELGQQLLEDDINRHEELLIKIYNENATPQEYAEFRYLRDRLKRVSIKISDYIQGVNEIKSK